MLCEYKNNKRREAAASNKQKHIRKKKVFTLEKLSVTNINQYA